MKRARGFTLLEAAIVIAVIAVLAGLTGSAFRAARRNATVGATALELSLELQSLKMRALTSQKDYLLVLVNPVGNVSTACGVLAPNSCVRKFVLQNPSAGWSVTGFAPATPEAATERVDDVASLPAGIAMDVAAAGTAAPDPFAQVKQLDSAVKATCATRTCVAIRFGATGEVSAEYAGASKPTLLGVAIGLTTDKAMERPAGADRRAVLVSFPTGLVKTFAY